jgi:hypothetical protein
MMLLNVYIRVLIWTSWSKVRSLESNRRYDLLASGVEVGRLATMLHTVLRDLDFRIVDNEVVNVIIIDNIHDRLRLLIAVLRL